jgi:hypothetical protein
MAHGARGDLHNRPTGFAQPLRIVISREVADYNAGFEFGFQPDPGDESTLSTSRPRAWKKPRLRSASRSFLARIASRSSNVRRRSLPGSDWDAWSW